MKKSRAVETEETDKSNETGSLIENTKRNMSYQEVETSTRVSGTSQEVARQMKAVTDPPTQHLSQLCELI